MCRNQKDYYTHKSGAGFDIHNFTSVDFGAQGTYSTHLFTRAAQQAIRQAAAASKAEAEVEAAPRRPLFLYLAYQVGV